MPLITRRSPIRGAPRIFAAAAGLNVVADSLREKNDRLGATIDACREDVVAEMAFPKERCAQTASTNPLERVDYGSEATLRRHRRLSQRRGDLRSTGLRHATGATGPPHHRRADDRDQ
jgi:hypothetical protein